MIIWSLSWEVQILYFLKRKIVQHLVKPADEENLHYIWVETTVVDDPTLLDSWSWTLHLGNHQQTSWMFLLFCFLSSSYIKAQSPHYLYFRTHGYLLDSTLVSVTVEFLDPFSAVPVLHASLSWFMTLQFWSTVTVALLDFAVLCALLLCCITPLSWRIVVFFFLFCFFPPFSPSTAGVFLARMTKIYSCTFI